MNFSPVCFRFPRIPLPALKPKWGFAAFLIMSAAGSAVIAAELKFPVLWQKDLQTFLESAATVADLSVTGSGASLTAIPKDQGIAQEAARADRRSSVMGRSVIRRRVPAIGNSHSTSISLIINHI